MIRNKAYIEAGKKKIQKAPAYGLSMPELEHYIASVTDDETFIKALTNMFYLGVEAGYRMASNRPQRKSYEMGYKDGLKANKRYS